MGRAGRAAREADRVRGRARDRLVGRPEEPARLRPPLLRVLPPGDARRAARVRGDRAHGRASPTDARAAARRAAPELDPDHADTAVFYSISNCQPGLAGVNLGTALIKQVVEAARASTCPQLHRFVTLSPIPGFRAWLEHELAATTICATHERELLPAEPARVLARLSDDGLGRRRGDPARAPGAVSPATSTTPASTGGLLDPVANFHLANGASVERINWLADPSPTGRAALGRLDGELPVRARPHRRRAPRRYARDGEVAMSTPCASCKESLAELGSAPWRSSSTSSGIGRRVDPDDAARRSSSTTSRLACSPRAHARLADATSTTATRRCRRWSRSPTTSCPCARASRSGSTRTTSARAVEDAARRAGIRRAGYLVTESMYRDYGDNEHAPPRDWPDGERSPGIVTLTVFDKPAGIDDETFYGHWYGHQSPMSEGMQPRARYVRNAVVRALTPGAPRYKAIVEEAWPSVEHLTDLHDVLRRTRRARSSASASGSCSTARSCCTTPRRCATTRSASTSSRADRAPHRGYRRVAARRDRGALPATRSTSVPSSRSSSAIAGRKVSTHPRCCTSPTPTANSAARSTRSASCNSRATCPPLLVVGIGYRVATLADTIHQRTRDLTPTAWPAYARFEPERTEMGGAPAFLAFIREELMPWVGERYSSSPDATLLRSFARRPVRDVRVAAAPDTFSRYVIGSPSLWWHDHVIFDQEAEYAATHDDLAARVFFGIGADETHEGRAREAAYLDATERAKAGRDLPRHGRRHAALRRPARGAELSEPTAAPRGLPGRVPHHRSVPEPLPRPALVVRRAGLSTRQRRV